MTEPTKPTSTEEEYFAREEIELKRKLALKQKDELAAKQQEERRKLHFMKCPKCGMDLQTLHHGKVEVDTCFNCHGVWLDAGELEALMKQGGQGAQRVMDSVLGLFRKG